MCRTTFQFQGEGAGDTHAILLIGDYHGKACVNGTRECRLIEVVLEVLFRFVLFVTARIN